MDFTTALNLAIAAIDIIVKTAPVVKEVVTNFEPIVEALIQKFTGKPLTDDQRTQLREQIIKNHTRFQQPIPPEDQQ